MYKTDVILGLYDFPKVGQCFCVATSHLYLRHLLIANPVLTLFSIVSTVGS